MALKNEIQAELIKAMKAGEELKVSVLRMLKAAILKFEVSGDRKEATDDDILQLINKEIKSRKDSVEQFKAGNRPELAEKEEKEIDILIGYMPPQMSEEEIVALVKETIAEVGAKGMSDVGRVMGALVPKTKGKADNSVVSSVVRALLAELK